MNFQEILAAAQAINPAITAEMLTKAIADNEATIAAKMAEEHTYAELYAMADEIDTEYPTEAGDEDLTEQEIMAEWDVINASENQAQAGHAVRKNYTRKQRLVLSNLRNTYNQGFEE